MAYRPELIQKHRGETRDKYLDKTPPNRLLSLDPPTKSPGMPAI